MPNIDLFANGVFERAIVATEQFAEEYAKGRWQLSSKQSEHSATSPIVPVKVTRRQARQALFLAGLLDQVVPAIESMPDEASRQLALIEWEDSLEFERNRALLIQLGYALGLDDQGLDQLFITAAGL